MNAAFSITRTRPHIPWWPAPQNSWQGTVRSDGVANRVVAVEM